MKKQENKLPESVRIIPISGSPLETTGPESVRSSFSMPDAGFLLGPENRLLSCTLLRLLGEQATPHSPDSNDTISFQVLFCGPSGTGKTHLAQGIASIWKKLFKRKSVYFSGADFARALADAIETRSTNEFRRRIRTAERMVIDDIDDLRGKPAAQEELLYAIEALRDSGGQTVLTSRALPGDRSAFESRLFARIQAGLCLSVSLPGPEVREEFVRKLTRHHNIDCPAEMRTLLVKYLPLSFPEIYGSIIKMHFEATASGTTLKTGDVERILKLELEAARPNLAMIAKKTASHFSLKLADLKGKARSSNIARARNIAIYLARRLTELSLKEIGKYFGNRDHTTISHLNDSLEKKITHDKQLAACVNDIISSLKRR